ncbi:Nif11-like leader peptide family natural product precursor [Crocosphaera sp.]|uniref:Nif11-like leader peptide family natural product precursor n=1 Tax=Crocosphaera sp. TaxID=2729996 RepID=UPI003F257A4B|nr:Nif11-like leader peptide family natural product precursor [Crocosphaera sp.]
MAQQNVIKLFRDLQKNSNLRNQFEQVDTPLKFVAVAGELGYHFTLEEWQELTAFKVEEYECELSEIPGL